MDSFARLPAYISSIKDSNPGSHAVLRVIGGQFYSMISQLSPITIDGTHLTSKFQRTLEGEHWADSYFSGLHFGHRTSNIAESFNSWILEARGMPVLAMMERIRMQMMLARVKRLEEVLTLKQEGKRISEFAARELDKSVSFARQYIVISANAVEYEVRTRQNECFPVRLDQVQGRGIRSDLPVWHHAMPTVNLDQSNGAISTPGSAT
ncbi:hypothetical protein V1523DRAFT_398160 [Lipomyces doorenjongii]